MLLPEEKNGFIRIIEAATGSTAVMVAVVLSSVAGMNAYFTYQPAALEADAAQSQLSAPTSTVMETVVCPNESAAQCIAQLHTSAIQSVTVVPDQGITILTVNTAQAFASTAGDGGLLSVLLQTGRPIPSVADREASSSIGEMNAVAPIPAFLPIETSSKVIQATSSVVATSTTHSSVLTQHASTTPATSTVAVPPVPPAPPAQRIVSTSTASASSSQAISIDQPVQPTLGSSSPQVQTLQTSVQAVVPSTYPAPAQPNFIQQLSGSFVIGSFTIVNKIKGLLNL